MWFRLAGVVLATVGLTATGCAPSLATMEPARTTPAGHFQVTTSIDVTDTGGPIRDAIEELRGLGGGRRMTAGELRTAAEAASAALVQPPSIGYQVSLSYGITKRFEVGVRSSLSAVRGWTRFQFLRAAPGFYGAVGVGVSGYLYGFPLQQFSDDATLRDYDRWDVDIPLSFGFSSRAFHVWAGPKLLVSSMAARAEVCVDQDEGRCSSEADVGLEGVARYVAGQVGLGVGWRRFFVAAELTVARVESAATLTVEHAGRSESDAFDLDGTVLSPAIGLFVWF